MTPRNGLDSLLRPEDSVLVLIDHQPYQLANLNSHDPHMVVNNTTALAKLAKAFNVPTILTSVIAARGGLLFKQITDVFPDQEVIDRTWVNTWQDENVVNVVKATGRKQLIIAGLWTEVCVAMPVIQAAGEGWDVTVITDASGGISKEFSRGCHPANDRGRRERDDRDGARWRMATRLGAHRACRGADRDSHPALRRQRHRVSLGAAASQHASSRLIPAGMASISVRIRIDPFAGPRHAHLTGKPCDVSDECYARGC